MNIQRKHCYAFIARLGACIFLLAGLSFSEAKSAETEYQEISWESLLPEAWQTTGSTHDRKSDTLSENEPVSSETLERYLEQRKEAPANSGIQGRNVKIQGFVVPLEWNSDTELREFLLVPYFGACIHVPPPPQNQIIHVTLKKPLQNIRSMDVVSVYGKIEVQHVVSDYGTAAYSLKADRVEVYTEFKNSAVFLAVIITLLCGLSVSFGLVIGFLTQKKSTNSFGLMLSFSAGVMISLGISAVIAHISWESFYSFLAGVFFMVLVEYILHVKNTEKHAHHTSGLAAIAIAIHNFPECFVVFSIAMTEPVFGIILCTAAMAHNIPLGISIAVPNKHHVLKYQVQYAFFSGIFPACAGIFVFLFARSLLSPGHLAIVFSGVGGIMTFIAIKELLPSAFRYGKRTTVITGFCSGILFMLVMLISFPYRG